MRRRGSTATGRPNHRYRRVWTQGQPMPAMTRRGAAWQGQAPTMQPSTTSHRLASLSRTFHHLILSPCTSHSPSCHLTPPTTLFRRPATPTTSLCRPAPPNTSFRCPPSLLKHHYFVSSPSTSFCHPAIPTALLPCPALPSTSLRRPAPLLVPHHLLPLHFVAEHLSSTSNTSHRLAHRSGEPNQH